MERSLDRRRALQLLGGASLATIAAACGKSSSSADGGSSTTSTTAAASSSTTAASSDPSSVSEIPEETGGPYPGDGTNGPNVLTQDGIVRSDITKSFGQYSGTAEGVP